MSVEFYKLLHLCGILLAFCGLAGACGAFAVKGSVEKSLRISMAAAHGLGLALVLIGGFGMAAKLGLMQHFPLWLCGKILIWLILGGSMVLAKRKATRAPALIGIWVLLGTAAAYLAIFKPF